MCRVLGTVVGGVPRLSAGAVSARDPPLGTCLCKGSLPSESIWRALGLQVWPLGGGGGQTEDGGSLEHATCKGRRIARHRAQHLRLGHNRLVQSPRQRQAPDLAEAGTAPP